MRSSRTTAAFAIAVSLYGLAPAAAFQELPVPAPSPSVSQEAKPKAKAPVPTFGTRPPTKDVKENDGVQFFGYTVMPRLDFGLDLLYGQDHQQLELDQGQPTLDADSDITVLGKVKRRF